MGITERDIKDAKSARRLFAGQRLRIARELRGLSQQKLGVAAGGLSGAAISQFERGGSRPNSKTLAELADALKFPVRFFASDARGSEPDLPAFFRSLRSTTSSGRSRARAFVELVRQFALALERHVDFPEFDVPDWPLLSDGERQTEVEDIAGRLRRDWELRADQPIKNMVRLVERRGVIAVRRDFGDERMDAFSVPYPDRPVIVLCADKNKRDRSRFDAAHEIGHLVMHRYVTDASKDVEKQAHHFAAAFLMPAEAIIDELPSVANWSRLMDLKGKWGASMASLLYRARKLGKMTDADYVRAMKTMATRGWRTDEPGDLGVPESPVMLQRAVEMLEAEGIALRQLAEEAAIPLDEINEILRAVAPTRQRVTV